MIDSLYIIVHGQLLPVPMRMQMPVDSVVPAPAPDSGPECFGKSAMPGVPLADLAECPQGMLLDNRVPLALALSLNSHAKVCT